MSDLNSIMFYKAKFTILALEEKDDLLWRLLLHIRNWQTRKWNKGKAVLDPSLPMWTKLKFGDRVNAKENNNAIYIESEYFHPSEHEEYWACKIVEKRPPEQNVCLREWVTEIGFERSDESKAVFSCVLSYGDIPGFIGPCEEPPNPSLPKLIRMLLQDEYIECYSGNDRVTTRAQHLLSGSFPAFWDSLRSSEREMPYIYISPKRETYDSAKVTLPIDPHMLSETVCANALVFYSDSLDFSKEMEYLCDERYSCYAGRIKVYMPRINTEDATDAYRHRFLTSSYISEVGTDEIIRIFRRALAQNVNFYEAFFRLRNCREKKIEHGRQQRLSELRSRHEQEIIKLSDQKFEEEFEQHYKAEKRILELESDIEKLKGELSYQSTENYQLENQMEIMRIASSKCVDLEKALSNRFCIQDYPKNTSEVVHFFSTFFCDKIAFSDDALQSLKTCTLPNAKLWETLYHIAKEMSTLFCDGSSDPYQEFHHRTGIRCARGEGAMTRKDKKLMRQFETIFDGRTIDIEPHITFPKEGQSIHFGYDDISQKIVIGHCGTHLKIYSTQKAR